jgi:hypothetical protein
MDTVFSSGERHPRIGMISNHIILEKWYWFYNNIDLSIDPNNKDPYVAVVRGSKAEYWLSQQGYNNILKVGVVE